MIKITDDMRALVDNSLADGVPCLLGTADADGRPQIGPKGSVLVLDDERLAYWERSKRSALDNVGRNPHVVVYYRNPAKADVLPRGAALRFHGDATMHEDGAVRDEVMSRVVQAELDKDPDRTGVAVVIRVDKITSLMGESVQQRD